MAIRVRYHHEDSGLCQTTFKVVDETPPRYFNRVDRCGWFTVYPSKGYWENSSAVRDDIVFEVVDGDGNTLFTESNGNLGAFQSIGDRARQFAKEWAERLHLRTYEDWKKWLTADMELHGYTGYVENWMYARAKSNGTEIIGSYEHLGIDFEIKADDDEHAVSGKKWRYVYVFNKLTENTEAICGFIFEEDGHGA